MAFGEGRLFIILERIQGPVVIDKMSPCSIWQGLWAAAREMVLMCTQNRELESPPRLNTGGLVLLDEQNWG